MHTFPSHSSEFEQPLTNIIQNICLIVISPQRCDRAISAHCSLVVQLKALVFSIYEPRHGNMKMSPLNSSVKYCAMALPDQTQLVLISLRIVNEQWRWKAPDVLTTKCLWQEPCWKHTWRIDTQREKGERESVFKNSISMIAAFVLICITDPYTVWDCATETLVILHAFICFVLNVLLTFPQRFIVIL